MSGATVVTTMSSRKVLFVGCSHTADSGFTINNRQLYHWPYLLSKQYNFNVVNLGIGGSSNEEIFYRTIQAISQEEFTCVIVMWSELGRKWAYFEDNNIDDYTILNNGEVKGYLNYTTAAQDYAKLHYTYFNNTFINLRNWLSQIIALESTLINKKQPFFFIKGFENYILDLENANYSYNMGFTITSDLREILNLDNNPDIFISKKLQQLKKLVNSLNRKYWLNFTTPAFISSTYCLDYADDLSHPGPKSNEKLTQDLIKYCDSHRLFEQI